MSKCPRSLLARLSQLTLALPRKIARAHRARRAPIMAEVAISGKTWRVEVATSASDRYIGLGGRGKIEPATGMLFVYPSAGLTTFTMRGCLTPLDIAFISAGRRVLSTDTMAVESDGVGRTPYLPPSPAKYVLEVPAGELTAAGVTDGALVTFAGRMPIALLSDPRRLS